MNTLNHSIVDQVLGQIRVCIGCGSTVGFFGSIQRIANPLLCSVCETSLQIFSSQNFGSGYALRSLALYEWREANARIARKLIMSLKGSVPQKLMDNFAQNLIQKRLELLIRGESFRRDLIFIPSPPRIRGVQDHAFVLASALSKCIQSKFYPTGVRANKDHQKSKREVERWSNLPNRIVFRRKLSTVERNESLIIFVDDLITSGATAYSAYLSLKKPKYFEVWTIFRRPRLRGRGHFDITHHT